jgi:RNA polymerase sigma factor (TIGR02999 family)
MTPHSSEVTVLLRAWSGGDLSAQDKLFPLVLAELKRLAQHYMARERAGHTLQAGALVNEAYLRLVEWNNTQWENRAHFFAICARLMRQILVDHARARQSQKRGDGALKVPLGDAALVSETKDDQLLALDDAMRRLAEVHPRKSEVIEMRFFGGLSVDETAEVLNVSRMTVIRDFNFARAWLHDALNDEIDLGSEEQQD